MATFWPVKANFRPGALEGVVLVGGFKVVLFGRAIIIMTLYENTIMVDMLAW
jgi:hypothetical protein